MFALLSFLAAMEAVLWTARLFEVEVRPILGQTACSHGSSHRANKNLFMTDQGQVLLGNIPVGFAAQTAEMNYHEHHVAFTNLGRTALADIKVKVCFEDTQSDYWRPYIVSLDNLRCDDEVHVAIYISRALRDVNILWGEATQEGKPISFFAADRISREKHAFYFNEPKVSGFTLADPKPTQPADPAPPQLPGNSGRKKKRRRQRR